MMGYATIGTNDMPRALAFYDALLADVGGRRGMDLGERGCIYVGKTVGEQMLGVMRPYDNQPAQPGNGTMIALLAPDPATVDALHARALALGGTDEGAPGPRPAEGSPFYGAYARDLDGNKLAFYHWRQS